MAKTPKIPAIPTTTQNPEDSDPIAGTRGIKADDPRDPLGSVTTAPDFADIEALEHEAERRNDALAIKATLLVARELRLLRLAR